MKVAPKALGMILLFSVGALVLDNDLARAQSPAVLQRWDPGFGPFWQLPPPLLLEDRIRMMLDCARPALVCCDPCDTCVCEPHLANCPPIMLADRSHCRPPRSESR